MKLSGNIWLVLFLVLLGTGCATTKVDWSARVGSYTYDQAVTEMGPPDRSAKLEDNTIVADWLTDRGSYHAYPDYTPSYHYWRGAAYQSLNTFRTPDYYIRLNFGPDGKLRTWKKVMQ